MCSTPPLEARQRREARGGATLEGYAGVPTSSPVGGFLAGGWRCVLGVLEISNTNHGGEEPMVIILVTCRPVGGRVSWTLWKVRQLVARGQLVAADLGVVVYWTVGGSRTVGGLLDSWWPIGLRILARKFLGDTSADFLYGKKCMALYVKRLFPYKKVLAHG